MPGLCAKVGVFRASYRTRDSAQAHVRSVCHQSFPHLWKKLWKFTTKPRFHRSVGAENVRKQRFCLWRKFNEIVQF
jgi:hypothetical protein